MTFNIDTKQVKRFKRELGDLNARGMPFAIRNTLNDAAFDTMKRAKLEVREKMITRNNWTVGSIQATRAQGSRVNTMQAAAGSIQDYMATQELGGVKRSKGKQGVPLATSTASGEGENARPRKRLPRKPNKLRNIQISSRRVTGTRKQRNAALVKAAVETGRKYVYLDLGRRKGIFKVMGGKRRPRPKMIWALGRRSVAIPRNPWLEPSITPKQQFDRLFISRMREQITKARLFKGR